jgi:hypothetical protein
MGLPRTVSEILRDHTTLEVESIDWRIGLSYRPSKHNLVDCEFCAVLICSVLANLPPSGNNRCCRARACNCLCPNRKTNERT